MRALELSIYLGEDRRGSLLKERERLSMDVFLMNGLREFSSKVISSKTERQSHDLL